jgi:hypothetical protein
MEWLEDDDFICKHGHKYDSEGKFFREVCHRLKVYLKTCPVKNHVAWDKISNNHFYINHLDRRLKIKVNDYETVDAFMDTVHFWISQYFIGYSVDYVYRRDATLQETKHQELLDKNKGIKRDIDYYLTLQVTDTQHEDGIIEKIYFREDKFILNINGVKSMRHSGKDGKIEAITFFNNKVHDMYFKEKVSPTDLRNYIMNNSFEIKKLGDNHE